MKKRGFAFRWNGSKIPRGAKVVIDGTTHEIKWTQSGRVVSDQGHIGGYIRTVEWGRTDDGKNDYHELFVEVNCEDPESVKGFNPDGGEVQYFATLDELEANIPK